jgi:hypothetical protein
MTHKRNVEGLRHSAQKRHQAALERLEEGIRRLNREGRPINFKTVSEAAGLSTAWLYQHPEVKERIEYLREQFSTRPKPPPKTRTSDASKDAIIATLRQRVKRLEEENRELRKQVEAAYYYFVSSPHQPDL